MKKTLLILTMALALCACSKDNYKSQRHNDQASIASIRSSNVSKNKKKSAEESVKENASNMDTFYTVEDFVNLRSVPSTEGDVVTLINPGSKIKVINDNEDGWTRVMYNNNTGYIKNDLLKELDQEEIEKSKEEDNDGTIYTNSESNN